MDGRVEAYVHEQKERIQEMILRGDPVKGTLPWRIMELASEDPILVDTILFDGYLVGIGEGICGLKTWLPGNHHDQKNQRRVKN